MSTNDDQDRDLPPRPYEESLSKVLTAACRAADPTVISVTVEGRACFVEDAEDVERYLLSEDVITWGIGIAAGAGGEPRPVVLLAWDDEAGAVPVDDGLTWTEDGSGGHWCLDPETCEHMRREQLPPNGDH